MKIIKLNEATLFSLEGISFLELKTIKEACLEYAQKGSVAAKKLYLKIDEEMNNVTI